MVNLILESNNVVNAVSIYSTPGLWLLLILYWLITVRTNSQTSFASELFSLAEFNASRKTDDASFSLWNCNLW